MADPRDEALALAADVVARALAHGASDAEATVTVAQRFSAEARGDVVTGLQRSTGRSLDVRIFAGTRRASIATTDLRPEAIEDALRRAVDAAAFAHDDPHAGLPEAADAPALCDHDLFTVAADVAERDDEATIAEALAMEATARGADGRIVNSDGARSSSALVSLGLANSRGFRGVTQTSRAARTASAVALDGEAKRIGEYGSAARGWATCEAPGSVALHAVHRAVALIGARKPATTRCAVIFERDVAAAVLRDVFAALSAQNVAAGNSWLADRIGARIGSERVTIVDDGVLRGGLGSTPFDGEGVAQRETVVMADGVLCSYLADTYWGRRIGIASTGNAGGSGVAPTNLYLRPGTGTLDDLVASTERGILVLDTIGFATEHASGTYSRGARGIWIENGEPAFPVDECTISGRFPDMLAAVDGMAGDLRFDATVVAPSFRVGEMQLSGT